MAHAARVARVSRPLSNEYRAVWRRGTLVCSADAARQHEQNGETERYKWSIALRNRYCIAPSLVLRRLTKRKLHHTYKRSDSISR
jgi:hypothetical protein